MGLAHQYGQRALSASCGRTALAETPDGRHTIDWQVDGWRRNELGRLWRPEEAAKKWVEDNRDKVDEWLPS